MEETCRASLVRERGGLHLKITKSIETYHLIADSTQQKPSKQKMTKSQVISLLKSNSNLMEEEEDLTDYINQVDWSVGKTVDELNENFENFKIEKYDR